MVSKFVGVEPLKKVIDQLFEYLFRNGKCAFVLVVLGIEVVGYIDDF